MQLQKEVVHYPTLKTILAIEEVVKKANNPVSRNQILARLQTGVMRSTLNLALDYMEKRGMVFETKKGFIWTFNPSVKDYRCDTLVGKRVSINRFFSRLEVFR